MHPLAAVWANAAFEQSLAQLKNYQARCFDIITALNEIGLTETIDFAIQRIEPTFFRLTAAWQSADQQKRLERELRAHGFRLRVENIGIAPA